MRNGLNFPSKFPWMHIWKAYVHNNGCLVGGSQHPVNLHRCKYPISSMCKICNLCNKSKVHVLGLYCGVLEVWNQCSIKIKVEVPTYLMIKEWMPYHILEKSRLGLFLFLLWSL